MGRKKAAQYASRQKRLDDLARRATRPRRDLRPAFSEEERAEAEAAFAALLEEQRARQEDDR